MFFELHDEKRIGYKPLSTADLGTGTSHQTHIGLSEEVLKYLGNTDVLSEDSIFIYNDKFEYIDAYFDRIKTPQGTYRSPKIRIGDRGCVSIVSTIREIVKSNPLTLQWYLLWFGLKSEKLVFFLCNNQSEDYNNITKLGVIFSKVGTKALSAEDGIFDSITQYIENKINQNGAEVLKELEIITQTEVVEPNKKFKKYDIDKANERSRKVGRNGEELINLYLTERKRKGEILTYTWCNEDGESGSPYDFSYQDNFNNVFFFDVKTTDYDFSQKIIFSSQELQFIAKTPNHYNIYRVYRDKLGEYQLRVCENCKDLSIEVCKETESYVGNLAKLDVSFKGSKLAFSPTMHNLQFNENISLSAI